MPSGVTVWGLFPEVPREGCEQGMVVDRDIRERRMERKAGARAWDQEERGAPTCGLVRVRPLPEEEMGNLGGVGLGDESERSGGRSGRDTGGKLYVQESGVRVEEA